MYPRDLTLTGTEAAFVPPDAPASEHDAQPRPGTVVSERDGSRGTPGSATVVMPPTADTRRASVPVTRPQIRSGTSNGTGRRYRTDRSVVTPGWPDAAAAWPRS